MLIIFCVFQCILTFLFLIMNLFFLLLNLLLRALKLNQSSGMIVKIQLNLVTFCYFVLLLTLMANVLMCAIESFLRYRKNVVILKC